MEIQYKKKATLVHILYSDGYSIKDISYLTDLPYSFINKIITEKPESLILKTNSNDCYQKKGYTPEQRIYLKQKLGTLIKIRLLELNKNQNWLSEQLGIKRERVSSYARKITFPDDNDLLENILNTLEVKPLLDDAFETLTHSIKEKGYNSPEEYISYLKEQKKLEFQNRKKNREEHRKDYLESLAQKKGFKSHYDYKKSLAEQNQQLQKNQRLANILKSRLRITRKTHFHFAKKLGIHPNSFYLYVSARSFPPEEVFSKICSVFNLPYKTIDDFLK